ncbi:membrane protein insertase YidC [Draconibacterium halophilum]|uniref:Membrane protein insertase YidC n=1 Tax=Draconibacterium halophilum TaxID=2706887 RepID=A0A6C0RI20_9BACT|nr:membrane protein insertase YidC [Draconibacterium halophilum]QIA09717.1 membrane protein insertase YidC [Draconibacterium halophilum]
MDKIFSPFIFLVRTIFEVGYNLTGSYGVAILLLSFAISLLLLPIFIYIEKAKKSDDAVKKRMQPLIDEIKQVYTGQERYYYLKTLNRQFGYSHFKALVPILSLLVQIPFFIAAYQYLDNLEAIEGVSFGPLDDLSKPDHLFGIVNVLPILMTVVNLLTAWFYTRHGNTSERKQMVVIAGVFLVLLFNLPSGLVLYWTMNNVFAFLRLFITNREVFKQSDKAVTSMSSSTLLPAVFFVLTFLTVIGQINWALSRSLEPLPARILASLFGSMLLTSLIGLLFRSFRITVREDIRKNKKQYFQTTQWSVIVALLAVVYWSITHRFDHFIGLALQLSGAAILIVWWCILIKTPVQKATHKIQTLDIDHRYIYIAFAAVIYFYLSGKYYYHGVNNELLVLSGIVLIPLQILLAIRFFSTKYRGSLLWSLSLIISSILMLIQIEIFLVTMRNSFVLFSWLSLPESIKEQCNFASIIFAGILSSVLPFYFAIKRKPEQKNDFSRKWIIAFALVTFYLVTLVFWWKPMMVYASFPYNFNFVATDIIENNFSIAAYSFLFALILFLVAPNKLRKGLTKLMLGLSILFYVNTFLVPVNVGTLQDAMFSEENKLAFNLWFYVLEFAFIIAAMTFVSFLIKKNYHKYVSIAFIAFIILTIGQSSYVAGTKGNLFVEKKGDKNGVAVEKVIPFSQTKENILFFIPDGLQGWYMKDLLEEHPEYKEIFKGFKWYPNTVSTSNFTYASMPAMMCGDDFNIANMNAMDEESILKKYRLATETFYDRIKENDYYFSSGKMGYSSVDYDRFDNFIPWWDPSWDKVLKLGSSVEIWYTRFWENSLFYGAPLCLKPIIYNERDWLVQFNESYQKNNETIPHYFVQILPNISVNTSTDKNFIFFHTSYTHAPWNVVENGQITKNISPYRNQVKFFKDFSKWMKWLQENNVYDNTKIVIASDHGPEWYHYDGKADVDVPLENYNYDKFRKDLFLRLNCLMLVKDFNAEGPLQEDWRTMSNADVPSILFNDNDPTQGEEQVGREIYTFLTWWHQDLKTRSKYNIRQSFKVKGNIYDYDNWEQMEANEQEKTDE